MKKYPNGYPYAALLALLMAFNGRTDVLANHLRELRLANGMSCAAFARHIQANTTVKTKFGGKYGGQLVWSYEHGKCSPKIDNLIAICEVFQVNPIWLCGYKVPDHVTLPTIFRIPGGFKVYSTTEKKNAKTGKPSIKIVATATRSRKSSAPKTDRAAIAEKLTPDMTIGKRIALCRKVCNLTQAGLSARCSMVGVAISAGMIGHYENNRYNPDPTKVKVMAKAMKLPYKLLSGEHAKDLRKIG